MKLAKLLLLVPAFAMMIGCKSTPVESSEEVDTHITTEQVWNAQLHYAEFIKPGQNKTTKVSAERGAEYAAYYTFKQDGNKYESTKAGGITLFYLIDPDSYIRESKKYEMVQYYQGYEDEWTTKVIRKPLVDLAYANFEYLAYTIDFKAFEYDKEEHQYAAKDFTVTIGETSLTVKEANIAFDNDQLVSLKAVLDANGVDATYILRVQSVGETTVTLPEVE